MDRDLLRTSRWGRLRAAAVLAAGALVAGTLVWLSPPAHATGGTVSDCPTTESALSADITSASGGTLVFNCATDTTITFDTPITVTGDVALDASTSTGKVIFDGNGENLWDGTLPAPDPLPTSTELLVVAAGGSLSLTGLTLQHAVDLDGLSSSAGAIHNFGTLTVAGCTFSDNASGGSKYMVDSNGTLDIFSAGGRGGAIHNDGTASVRDSTFTGNSSTHDAGAIYNTGTFTVSGSSFDGNSTIASQGHFGGAAIMSDHGTMTVGAGNSFTDNLVTTESWFPSEGAAITLWGGQASMAGSNSFSGNHVRLDTGDPDKAFQWLNAVGVDAGSLSVDNVGFTGQGDVIGMNGGQLTVTNSTFEYKHLDAEGDPTAIATVDVDPSTITLTNDSFTGFPQGAVGAGVRATITDCTFTDNGTADGAGSAVAVDSGTITDSTFIGNAATYGGAVFNQSGPLTISGSTFKGNHGRLGGAVFNQHDASLTIKRSTFTGNDVTGTYDYEYQGMYPRRASGGAVANRGNLTVSGSTFTGNTAPSDATEAGEVGAGGAIYDEIDPHEPDATPSATVSASTFSGNKAGGGAALYSDYRDTMTVTNSTFAGNTATGGERYSKGLSGTLSGGAVEGMGSSIVVRASTFDANTPAAMGGFDDDSFYDPNPYWTLGQNLFADPVVTGSCTWSGRLLTAVDLGHNLFTGPTTCVDLTDAQGAPVAGAGDLTFSNAELDAAGLADNGGPTQTIALRADSPAIGAVPLPDCQETDQRGDTRPGSAGGAGCDIGAFEFSWVDTETALQATGGSGPSIVGQRVNYTATVTSDSGTPRGTVTFSDGGSAITGCTDVAVTSGMATCQVTYSAPGSHSITAAYDGSSIFRSSSDGLTHQVWYGVQQIGDPPVAKAGSGVPVKFMVQAYAGGALTNVSDSAISVTALCVVLEGVTSCTQPTMSLGIAATYVAKLDHRRGGYQLTLHTPSSMAPGTYFVLLRAAGEPDDLAHTDATFVIQPGGGGGHGHGGR